MPHIHFFNIEKQVVEKFYNEELTKFYKLASASKEATHVVFHNTSYINEKEFAYVKIEWLSRPFEVKTSVKTLIEEFLDKHGYSESAINFSVIDPESYFVK